MTRPLVLVSVCLLIGGSAGYTLRALLDRDGTELQDDAASRPHDSGSTLDARRRASSAVGGTAVTHGSGTDAATAATSAASLSERMKELLADFNWKIAEKEAAKLSATDLQAALALVAALPKSSDRDSLRWYLYRAWAALNPAAAWQAALSDPLDTSSGYLLGAVAGELAKTKPAAAIDLALGLGMGGRRASVLREVIDEWGKLDLAAVVAYSNTHSDLILDSGAFTRGFRILADKDPLLAANLALTLKDTQARASSIYGLMQFWADRDPAAALAWAQSVTNPKQREAALAAAISTWANTDPSAAFAYAERISDASTRANAMQNAWNDWFRKDPAAAMTYMGSAGNENMLQGLGWKFASLTESFTLQERTTLLESIPDGETKQDIFTSLTDNHIRRGQYNQAMELLNSMADSGARDRNVLRLGEEWAAADLAAATAWIKVQPDSTDRDLAVAGFSRSLAKTDPAAAAQWAGTIPDQMIHDTALKNIAVRWLANDPASAETWLSGVPEISADEKKRIRESVAKYGDNTNYSISVGQRR